jgi:23S rRNA U2552 (ribose-2'-O)-methylase RlmE/FtsJ
MLYCCLPKFQYIFNKNDVNIVFSDYPSKPIVNKSLYHYLLNAKDLIHSKEKDWNTYKLLTNPYEYIHTCYNDSIYISKVKPISRSFYKLIEIYTDFSILDDYRNDSIQTLHLAEGPGGFIEATKYMRQANTTRQCKKDLYIGITLIDKKNKIVPNWDKLKSVKYSNIRLDYCKDNTGNLFKIENLTYVNEHYKNSMNIITADGGFDFSSNYNEQEHTILRLLLVQTMYAIICQKKNGTFIMKIFDNFNKSTNDILFLLSCFYQNVIICKPKTSRYANSEKYVVCRRFRYNNSTGFYMLFMNMMYELNINTNKYIYSIFNIKLNQLMLNKIQDVNAIFGQQQLDIINATLSLIDMKKEHDMIETLKRNHINKCLVWFQQYKIPYNVVKKPIMVTYSFRRK